MREVMVLVKYTVRLLLRNKGFLFFLAVLPILSVLILNINDYSGKEVSANKDQVYVLNKMSERICYDAKATLLPVKIYDSTEDGMGEQAAKELASAGIFQIFYYDTQKESTENIQKDICRTVQNDRIGAIVFLTKEFTKELKEGKLSKGMEFYSSNQDKRAKLLETTVETMIGNYQEIAAKLPEGEALVDAVKQAIKSGPVVQRATVSPEDATVLNFNQQQQFRRIGYVLAMLTISFLFSGVLIADTVIKERQYKVFSRIQLSEITPVQYILSKYIVCLVSVIIQTGIAAFALEILVSQEYAISKLQLMIIIAVLGFIFNTLSLCIGILCNNIMNSNYLAFVIWSVSCMLSGCYFDLSDAGKTMIGISNLMPQKWGLDAVKLLMTGQPGAYRILFLAGLAFLLVIASGGILGTTRSMEE